MKLGSLQLLKLNQWGKTSIFILTICISYGCNSSKAIQSSDQKPKAELKDTGSELDEPADDQTPEVLDLETILGQCGVTAKELEDPDAVLVDKTIRSWPKVFTGAQAVPLLGNINYRVSVTTLLTLKATMREIEQSTDFEIKGEPQQAEKPAWDKAAPNRGSSLMTVMDTTERQKLMSKGDWEGVFCTVLPVKELSTTRGGLGKVVKFKPALPGSLSPKADPERYAAELGESRTFSNIKAEIIGSSDPDYPEGEKFEGKVTFKKIDPTLTLNVGGKETQTIKADMAYKISYDFGSKEDTVGIGLTLSQTMYVNHKDKDIRVIVANTGFEEGGTVVLSDDFNP
jgi:hypothetical protein